jgi:hypothetical protein
MITGKALKNPGLLIIKVPILATQSFQHLLIM